MTTGHTRLLGDGYLRRTSPPEPPLPLVILTGHQVVKHPSLPPPARDTPQFVGLGLTLSRLAREQQQHPQHLPRSSKKPYAAGLKAKRRGNDPTEHPSPATPQRALHDINTRLVWTPLAGNAGGVEWQELKDSRRRDVMIDSNLPGLKLTWARAKGPTGRGCHLAAEGGSRPLRKPQCHDAAGDLSYVPPPPYRHQPTRTDSASKDAALRGSPTNKDDIPRPMPASSCPGRPSCSPDLPPITISVEEQQPHTSSVLFVTQRLGGKTKTWRSERFPCPPPPSPQPHPPQYADTSPASITLTPCASQGAVMTPRVMVPPKEATDVGKMSPSALAEITPRRSSPTGGRGVASRPRTWPKRQTLPVPAG